MATCHILVAPRTCLNILALQVASPQLLRTVVLLLYYTKHTVLYSHCTEFTFPLHSGLVQQYEAICVIALHCKQPMLPGSAQHSTQFVSDMLKLRGIRVAPAVQEAHPMCVCVCLQPLFVFLNSPMVFIRW